MNDDMTAPIFPVAGNASDLPGRAAIEPVRPAAPPLVERLPERTASRALMVVALGGLLAQLLFTPLLACWTVWVAIAISTRSSDVRVAQQLGVLASLPPVFITVMIALNVIEPTPQLAIGCGALLILLDVFGWRLVSGLFDRERLISGGH